MILLIVICLVVLIVVFKSIAFQKDTTCLNPVKEEYYTKLEVQQEREKEERENEKQEDIEFIISETFFWKELKINPFIKEIGYYEKNICPYCKKEIPERKSKIFKCPFCEEKIYKQNTLNNMTGYFTEKTEEKRKKELEEYKKRKKFTKLYRALTPLGLKCDFGPYKNDNKLLLMYCLHQAQPHLEAKNVNKFRMCRFYEAEFQELLNYPTEAINAWLAVAYIDTWGDYRDISLYQDDIDIPPEELQKIIYEYTGEIRDLSCYKREEIKEWTPTSIAPYGIERIKKLHDNPLKLEGLFKSWVVTDVQKTIKYKPPLNGDEAWAIIEKEFRKENV